MKQIFLISGLLIILLIILFLTGVIDFKNDLKGVITEGNQLYAAGKYEQALKVYNKGLEENTADKLLNYNLGQTSYQLKDYQQAIKYYVKSPDEVGRYIFSGNSSLKLANNADKANQKLQYYQQALQTYKHGILKFPRNVSLKYNYEYVKKKIDQLQKENNEKQKSNDQNKSNKDNENKDQDKKQDNQDQSNKKDNQKSKQNPKQQDNKSQKNNNQSNGQQESQKQSTQNKAQNGAGSQQKQGSYSKQNDREVEQALKMLERQEEDSLKNNQQVIGPGEEEEYDW